MPIKVKCPICKKELKVKPSKVRRQKNVFCSIKCKNEFQKGKPTWNKGMKGEYTLSDKHKKHIAEGIKGNEKIKITQFKKGHKWKETEKEKRINTIKREKSLSGKRNGMYGRNGKLNPNWKGGTSYWRKKYYNSIPYKEWQKAVFKRDDYKCQICGDTKKEKKILHAHHIKSFAKYPELRLELDNGITLCNICHTKVHSKRFQLGKVLSVEKKENKSDMIDIEVKDNNNFFANGVLVHNSATPYREDGRTDYIFALTGFPIGLSWDNLIELGVLEIPDVRVYIVSDWRAKQTKLKEILAIGDKKTIIFCDSIQLGNRVSKDLGVPFVHGQTSKRLEIINESDVSIVSRVGDEGISIPELQRIIEIDFLFGSRRQEGQRLGRLFHGEEKGEHFILMTEKEFEDYGKRLHSITEKGIKLEIIR